MDLEHKIGEVRDSLEQLTGELENFQDIAKYIKPLRGEVPRLDGIDIYGDSLPLNGVVGGDHIIYVDFKKRYDLDARIKQAAAKGRSDIVQNLGRCKGMAGIALVDVSGHQITDAMLAAMLHQAFLLGAIYELDTYGNITERLFENLNTRFYNSSSVSKFLTMLYGEISEDDTFRFLSAAHPPPLVFSSMHNRFMEVSSEQCSTFPPIGTLPSQNVIDRSTSRSVLGYKDQYEINEWELMGSGDILLLCTDGILEHVRGEEDYYPVHLQETLRGNKHLGAKGIFDSILADVLDFGQPADDISLVVIKRN